MSRGANHKTGDAIRRHPGESPKLSQQSKGDPRQTFRFPGPVNLAAFDGAKSHSMKRIDKRDSELVD